MDFNVTQQVYLMETFVLVYMQHTSEQCFGILNENRQGLFRQDITLCTKLKAHYFQKNVSNISGLFKKRIVGLLIKTYFVNYFKKIGCQNMSDILFSKRQKYKCQKYECQIIQL